MAEVKLEYKINWDTATNIPSFDIEYDEKTDNLFMQSKKQRPAVSIDCNGEFWCRVDPKTGEILGIEIEGFKSVFLKNHPRLLRETTAYARPIADFVRVSKCPVGV